MERSKTLPQSEERRSLMGAFQVSRALAIPMEGRSLGARFGVLAAIIIGVPTLVCDSALPSSGGHPFGAAVTRAFRTPH